MNSRARREFAPRTARAPYPGRDNELSIAIFKHTARAHSRAIQFTAPIRSRQLSRSVSAFSSPAIPFSRDPPGTARRREPRAKILKRKYRSSDRCAPSCGSNSEVNQKTEEKRGDRCQDNCTFCHCRVPAKSPAGSTAARRFLIRFAMMRPAGSRTASRPDSFGTTRRDLQRDHAITRSRVEERGNARAVLRATARNQLWLLGHHLVVPPPTATPSRGGLALCTRLARTDYGGDLVLPPPLPPSAHPFVLSRFRNRENHDRSSRSFDC